MNNSYRYFEKKDRSLRSVLTVHSHIYRKIMTGLLMR